MGKQGRPGIGPPLYDVWLRNREAYEIAKWRVSVAFLQESWFVVARSDIETDPTRASVPAAARMIGAPAGVIVLPVNHVTLQVPVAAVTVITTWVND